MLCKNPFMKGVQPCGCGQCMSCRINKSRMWSNRLMLESLAHENNTFVTLTYRDEELHDISEVWDGLRPVVGNLEYEKDAQKWLKRIRKRVGSFRYFIVGEYGGKTGRPHYHAALFGLPNCVYGKSRVDSKGRPMGTLCCGSCRIIAETWPVGHVYLGELNYDSAAYIAKYVTKKWTKEDSWNREKLMGRNPELVRMSLNPGIGATAIKLLINSSVHTRAGKYVVGSIDAPVVLRNAGKMLPLGRYLRGKWREALGRDKKTPDSVMGQYLEEMQALYSEEKSKKIQEGVPSCFIEPKSVYVGMTQQKIKNLEAKAKIRQNGGII